MSDITVAITAQAVWLDGSNGSDGNDGYASTRPVLTAAKALTQLGSLDAKILVYKNVREAISWSISNLQMFMWDRTVPSTRGDVPVQVVWTHTAGNVYSTSDPGVSIATVVVDWDTTPRTAWGGVPSHLVPVADLATCTTTINSYAVASGTWYINLNGDDPNAVGRTIAYSVHKTSGAMSNGITITGDNNYVEAWPALWCEAGGSGSGSNGKGGWGVLLNGNNCRVIMPGAQDCGYKAAAINGDNGIIEGVSNCIVAGFSNADAQGISHTNGNGALTIQGPLGADLHSGVIRNMTVYMHSLLQRGTATPVAQSWTGGFSAIICHGQGNAMNGVLIERMAFYDPFLQGQTIGGCDDGVIPGVETDGSTYPSTFRHCYVDQGSAITVSQYCCFDRNVFNLTNPSAPTKFYSSSATTVGRILLTGNVIVYNPGGGGTFFQIKDDGMKILSIGNTYVLDYSVNSNQYWCTLQGTTSRFYSRQDVVYMPDNSIYIGNKRLFQGVTDASSQVDMQYLYSVGVGSYNDAIGVFTFPANFGSSGTGAGTNQAFTDAAASSLFVNALTTAAQVGADYHLKTGAAATLLARNFITPHMIASPIDEPYNGQFGAYPYIGDMPGGGLIPMRNRPGFTPMSRNRRPTP